MLVGFIIEDEKNEIVMGGGVEAVAEAVLVTNRAHSGIKLGRALIEAQHISHFICRKYGIKELLAFVDDENYANHLIQHGFETRDEMVLRMRI